MECVAVSTEQRLYQFIRRVKGRVSDVVSHK